MYLSESFFPLGLEHKALISQSRHQPIKSYIFASLNIYTKYKRECDE